MMTETGSFGFALQNEKGSFVTPDTWLPTLATENPLALRRSYNVYRDRDSGADRYNATGKWADGSLLVPLVPGVIVKLLSWIQDRDSYSQGKWASLLVDNGGGVLKVRDAKVRTATFRLRPGEPVLCELDIAGLHAERGECYNLVMPPAAPYIYKEAEMEVATGGGKLEPATLGEVTVAVNNMIQDKMDDVPMALANHAGVRVLGTINRKLGDSAIYADFADGEEAAMLIELCRGANSLSLCLPRILYVRRDAACHPHWNSTPHLSEHVAFLGLGSTDGQTPPITLA